MLMSDYTLLEEASRAGAASARVAASVSPLITASARSKRAMLAKEAARHRIHLHLMPPGFVRRGRNTSHVRGRKDARTLFWHVDVVFVQPGKERRVHVDACGDTTSIAALVVGARDSLLNKRRRGVSRGGSDAPGALFANVPVDKMDVYIVNEHVIGGGATTASSAPAPNMRHSAGGGGGVSHDHDPRGVAVPGKAVGEDDLHRYLSVDLAASLGHTLADRIIVEFPILYVSLTGSAESAHISAAMAGVFEKPEQDSDSDDDDDEGDDDDEEESSDPSDGDKPEAAADASLSTFADIADAGELVDIAGSIGQTVKRQRIADQETDVNPSATADLIDAGGLPPIPRVRFTSVATSL
jgi:hypothetical protein